LASDLPGSCLPVPSILRASGVHLRASGVHIGRIARTLCARGATTSVATILRRS
jgi:hypothetical protein